MSFSYSDPPPPPHTNCSAECGVRLYAYLSDTTHRHSAQHPVSLYPTQLPTLNTVMFLTSGGNFFYLSNFIGTGKLLPLITLPPSPPPGLNHSHSLLPSEFAETIKVFDGNCSYRRKIFRAITVPRTCSLEQLLTTALRAFHIARDSNVSDFRGF